MGEILGIGLSHYPGLSATDPDMASPLRGRLRDPGVPDSVKDPATWPEQMRVEWGDDQGASGAAEHRAALVAGFDRCREAIDEFAPDVVVIWGDDQYENFQEDLIPPYSILAYPDTVMKPWSHLAHSSAMAGRANAWGEDEETEITIKGSPKTARWLAESLLNQGIDVSYAYQPLHHPNLAHAFLNTVLYLDYHRRGFPYPVIAFPLNCYGKRVICQRGFSLPWGEEVEFDPPSPPPWRFMEVGAAVARAIQASDLRVALISSASWSHAFMVDKTYRMQPDIEADRLLYKALLNGDYDAWRHRTLEEMDASGQQELLNWCTLVGAMEELGRTSPDWSTMVDSYAFNSPKVFAVWNA